MGERKTQSPPINAEYIGDDEKITMEIVESIQWDRLDVESGFGDIFTGSFNDKQLIKKVPRKVDLKRWKKEIQRSIVHSQARTGPKVFYASTHPSLIVMEKYDYDGFDIVERIIQDRSWLENFKNVTANLIERLAACYMDHPEESFCIGDFKLENIVYKVMEGHGLVDARQIDFDFCPRIKPQTFTRSQYVLLLKFALTPNKPFYRKTFGFWFMFGDELREHADELKTAIRILFANTDNNIRESMQRHSNWPWCYNTHLSWARFLHMANQGGTVELANVDDLLKRIERTLLRTTTRF